MSHPSPIRSDRFSHDLLVHDGDDDLLAGTRAFVEQGLSSGGQVIVHSTRERVAMLREALDPHPRLEFGLDEDLYQSPTSTLFAYQRAMAESPEPIELWATGTVPLGEDPATHPAWARYESVVNAVLGPYAFHGLCTYDARVLPPDTIAAARATHPCVSTRGHRTDSPEYQDPAEFLANPLAGVPDPPDSPPLVTASLESAQDLRGVRLLVRRRRRVVHCRATRHDRCLRQRSARGAGQWSATRCPPCAAHAVGRDVEADVSGHRHGARQRRSVVRLWLSRSRGPQRPVGRPPAVRGALHQQPAGLGVSSAPQHCVRSRPAMGSATPGRADTSAIRRWWRSALRLCAQGLRGSPVGGASTGSCRWAAGRGAHRPRGEGGLSGPADGATCRR